MKIFFKLAGNIDAPILGKVTDGLEQVSEAGIALLLRGAFLLAAECSHLIRGHFSSRREETRSVECVFRLGMGVFLPRDLKKYLSDLQASLCRTGGGKSGEKGTEGKWRE